MKNDNTLSKKSLPNFVNNQYFKGILCMNSIWTVYFVSYTVNAYDFTVHALGKKEKKKERSWKRERGSHSFTYKIEEIL